MGCTNVTEAPHHFTFLCRRPATTRHTSTSRSGYIRQQPVKCALLVRSGQETGQRRGRTSCSRTMNRYSTTVHVKLRTHAEKDATLQTCTHATVGPTQSPRPPDPCVLWAALPFLCWYWKLVCLSRHFPHLYALPRACSSFCSFLGTCRPPRILGLDGT